MAEAGSDQAEGGSNGSHGAGSNGAGSNGAGSNGAGSNGAGSNGAGSNGAEPSGGGPAVLGAIAALEGLSPNEPPQNLPLVLESLLLVAEEPPSVEALARATGASKAEVEEGLEQLGDACVGRGIRVQRMGREVRLSTAPEAAPYVERFLGLERPNRLSKAALETLAIIAYRQPVTKGAVEAVRGVGCDGSLQTLRDRDLVEAVGYADGSGHAYLYGTTARFLEHFGLQRVDELPPLGDGRSPVEQGTLLLQTAIDPGPLGADALGAELPGYGRSEEPPFGSVPNVEGVGGNGSAEASVAEAQDVAAPTV